MVVATSATGFLALPTARDLGIDHVLSPRVAVREGVLTGEVEGPVLWGEGKAEAVR